MKPSQEQFTAALVSRDRLFSQQMYRPLLWITAALFPHGLIIYRRVLIQVAKVI